MTVDSKTGKWWRVALYGGLWTENTVQGIARDILADGMQNAERLGYPIVLSIHDEAVADVHPESGLTLGGFEKALCKLEPYHRGIPVVAAGYTAFRYKKD